MNVSRCTAALVAAVVGALGAATDAAATPPTFFGLNLYTTDSDPGRLAHDMPNARWLGVRQARISVEEADRGRGRYDFRDADAGIRDLRRNGIEPLIVFWGTRSACGRRTSEPASCPPADFKEYCRFVRTVAHRYRRKVKVFESWNEPEQQSYGGMSPEYYTRLLRVQHRALKKGNRHAKLLLAATGGTRLDWVARVLSALRGRRSFDGAALHPYRFGSSPVERTAGVDGIPFTFKEELLAYRAAFAEHGYRLPDVWITEIGWGGSDETAGNGHDVTLEEQALYLDYVYTVVRQDPELSFVRSVHWYIQRDHNPAEVSEEETDFAHYGLFTLDQVPKPAAEAYRRHARGG